MRPQSAKAKGRRLQQKVRDSVQLALKLTPDDVRSTPMGSQGSDLLLSPVALKKFPYRPEIKCVEKLSIWEALEQAKAHAKPDGLYPLLVISRNHDDVYAVITLEDLLFLLAVRGEHVL